MSSANAFRLKYFIILSSGKELIVVNSENEGLEGGKNSIAE